MQRVKPKCFTELEPKQTQQSRRVEILSDIGNRAYFYTGGKQMRTHCEHVAMKASTSCHNDFVTSHQRIVIRCGSHFIRFLSVHPRIACGNTRPPERSPRFSAGTFPRRTTPAINYSYNYLLLLYYFIFNFFNTI